MNSSFKDLKIIYIFRFIGWLEGLSFLLLIFVGMPLKYIWQDPVVVKSLGMPHGILFMVYVVLSYIIGELKDWSVKVRALAVLAAVLPFGTFVFEKMYLDQK